MMAQDRIFHGIHTAPYGIGIDCSLASESSLEAIRSYALSTGSVQDVTGQHPFTLVTNYSGPSGIGLRGGGAAFATAFRYRALKAEGAEEAIITAARADVIRAIETLHVVVAITGEPGRVARGVQRLKPESPDDPPIPLGDLRDPVPLFDEQGNPLPEIKNNGTPRADNSKGALPEGEWSWEDSCSKDQLIGWVTAMGALYDAAKGDPEIDQELLVRMAADATAIAGMLQEKHEFEVLGGPPEYFDLVIMDADGRPTKHHDLNPSGVDGIWFTSSAGPVNPLNLLMSIGILKTLHHISGDPELEEYLYNELLSNRSWLSAIPQSPIDAGLYAGTSTNFSTVNMAALGIYNALHYETDPSVSAPLSNWLETVFWNPEGEIRGAKNLKQPYFHAIYLMNTQSGTSPELVAETADLLLDYTLGPYMSQARENCDASELESGTCIGLDGTTEITLAKGLNWHDEPVATTALSPALRPTSNFDARSDPFRVNGGGTSTSLLPGGDLLSAYWMLRWMQVSDAGSRTTSVNARTHIAVGGSIANGDTDTRDTQGSTADSSATDVSVPSSNSDLVSPTRDTPQLRLSTASDGGCTLSNPGRTHPGSLALILLLAILVLYGHKQSEVPTIYEDRKDG
jgi:hypothetical protein